MLHTPHGAPGRPKKPGRVHLERHHSQGYSARTESLQLHVGPQKFSQMLDGESCVLDAATCAIEGAASESSAVCG